MEPEQGREIRIRTKQELLRIVRETKILDKEVPIYKNAEIVLKVFNPGDARPLAKYVLSNRLEQLGHLGLGFSKYGIDIFDLDRIVEVGKSKIAPPVVEYSVDDGRDVIVDGIHRFFLARGGNRNIKCIYVRGVHPDYPTISLPISWQNVRVVKEIPKLPQERRDLRQGIPNLDRVIKNYFRDFSALGSLGRRPHIEQGE